MEALRKSAEADFDKGVSLEPDPVIEVYKKDVDRTLLRENLKLTVEQRIEKLASFMQFLEGIRGSAQGLP